MTGLNDLKTSLELARSSASSHLGYTPQFLEGQANNAPLTRNATGVSELSRILTALRDDHEQDVAEFESYKNRPAVEDELAQGLDWVDSNADQHLEIDDGRESSPESDHPVDGAFAYWQSFLTMLMVFSTWGANAAFGVFLNYYMTSNSFPGATQYDFALMGGVIVCLAQILAPISAFLVSVFGQRPVLIAGVVVQTVGYFLAAQCTKLWQIFVCQAVLVGLSFAFIFIPGTLVLPTWFDKSRSTAMGIAVAGAGLGGVVFSLSLNKIIQETGNQRWALRTVGFITLATSFFATVFLRVRNPKKSALSDRLKPEFMKRSARLIFDFTVFDNYPMVLLGVWFGLALLGYVIVLYSFSSYATSIGLSHTQGSNILAILNGAQVVGRPIVGNLGDYLGRSNTSAFICLYVAVLIFAFWLNTTTYAEQIALSVLIGMPVGVGSTMAQSLAGDILDKLGRQSRLPAAWSGLNIIVALFSLPAEVIALKLRKPSDGTREYRNSQIFTGCCFAFCFILTLINREWLVRKTFKSRRQLAQELLLRPSDTEDNAEKLAQDAVEGTEHLQARVGRYNQLLGRNPIYYMIRMFYPIRV